MVPTEALVSGRAIVLARRETRRDKMGREVWKVCVIRRERAREREWLLF